MESDVEQGWERFSKPSVLLPRAVGHLLSDVFFSTEECVLGEYLVHRQFLFDGYLLVAALWADTLSVLLDSIP